MTWQPKTLGEFLFEKDGSQDARQALGRAHGAADRFRGAERGRGGGDDEIAGAGDLAARADRRPLQHRDGRHRQRFQRGIGGEPLHAALAHLRLAHALPFLEICTRTEDRTICPDQHEPDVLAGRSPSGIFQKQITHLEIERVAALRAVQGERRDATCD